MGFFGFGKKNKEKEQEKMKTGLEKTRTGFFLGCRGCGCSALVFLGASAVAADAG